MFLQIENPVRKAVHRAGGPTKVSNLLGMSNSAIHNWIKAGYVPNIDKARQLAELSGVKLEMLRSVE